jgi:alkylated DNA repair dioxygenase AlkB
LRDGHESDTIEHMFAIRDAVDDIERLSWQSSLFSEGHDETRPPIERINLDGDSWVDFAPAWLSSTDAVFDHLLHTLRWEQREMAMFQKVVWQPRLSGEASEADVPAPLRSALLEIGDRYELSFDHYFANLYRDGQDSVAWHADKIGIMSQEPLVVIISMGATRTFCLRPKLGGETQRFTVTHGDLLVMGGRCQHDWEHSVPKTAALVGPRISFTARHMKDAN